MKCTIPEISWHNRDPVLSIDVQPVVNNEFYRLASGGTDSHVLIWLLRILDSGATSVEPVCDLTRHQRAVNVVRWSPTGQYLASGDDDANIIIWQQKADELAVMIDGETADKEKWSVLKILRGHKEDVLDISWSPNSLKLLSGSVDNTAIIWDLNKGTNDNILKDHKGFVQGISWDPQGQYLATLSSDRTCRLFNETGKNVKFRISKGCLNVPENHALHGQMLRYYHDDTLKSYFRRLSFSPDGSIFITPAGCLEAAETNKPLYTTYIFATDSPTQPTAILPSPGQYTIAVRFCPVLFELHPDAQDPLIVLPYRMVFAVATRSSVVLYDTQQITPFAVISNIHYTRLTDLTWSQDGRILAVSSTDGFCSLVTFEPNELGTEYTKDESDEENMDVSMTEEVLNESVSEEKGDDKKEEKKEPKKSNFLKKWAMKKGNKSERNENNEKSGKTMKVKDTNIILIDDSPPKKKMAIENPTTKKIVPINIIQVKRKPGLVDKDDIEKPTNSTTESPTQSPSTKNTTQAKPIAVRRKPRDQMDIKTFLKSPTESPSRKSTTDKTITTSLFTKSKSDNKSKDKNSTVIVSEDSVAQDAWPLDQKKDVKEVKQAEIITIEDSQDMKLVFEDTNCTDSHKNIPNTDFEKFQEEQTKKETDLSTIEHENEEITEENKTINDDAQVYKEISNETESSLENNSKITESTNSSNTCDLETNTNNSKVVNDINKQINEIQIHTPKRKKVPFITLSSPRNKKKDSS